MCSILTQLGEIYLSVDVLKEIENIMLLSSRFSGDIFDLETDILSIQF